MDLQTVSRDLADAVDPLTFGPPVVHVYNPLRYAAVSHDTYMTRYGSAPKDGLFLGMNPGPWGMAQTGIPFGDPTRVREFLGIDLPVGSPPHPHPRVPVLGTASPRREVSGDRLWGWVQARFGTPEAFFSRFLVVNWCPLCFLSATGSNLTPDHLPLAEQAPLFHACDAALRATVEHLGARFVVGVGSFAEARARAALAGLDVQVHRILHPSPASPAANRGWAPQVDACLDRLGVLRGEPA